ncbi:MAG: hypothetical protein OXU51_16510 [Candidatus Poribacteria bacterium]|nr:hypothetical protein [Candidatus Poribacteria bacterium]
MKEARKDRKKARKDRLFKDNYRKFYDRSENAYLYSIKRKTLLITFNGQGSAGKTTISRALEAEGVGLAYNLYSSRDMFQRRVYNNLERTHEQMNVEVFGIPSIAWMGFEFAQLVRPFLNAQYRIILDHYIGDYIAEMLPDLEDFVHFKQFMEYVQLPWFSKTISFYLDIDYDTYVERHPERNHFLKENARVAEKNFVPESLFDARRERYEKMVRAGYLIKIDATTDTQTVLEAVKNEIAKRRRKEVEAHPENEKEREASKLYR